MAYNFTNIGPQGLLPLFGGTAAMTSHPSFMNQLAAMSSHVTPTSTTTTNITSQARHEGLCTPETPPAPRLSALGSPKMKPNQGHAPMDLENDFENEVPSIPSNATTATAIAGHSLGTATAAQSKTGALMQMHDPNLFLNGLMSATGMSAAAAASGYMFYPTAQAAQTGSSSAGAAASLLMDPTAMMAAAMQQMQGYTYGIPADNGAANNVAGSATTDEVFNVAGGAVAVKEVIKTKNCMLIPPNPNAPPPTIRERPPGCRTVFVGGLPESISEEIIREIFDSCGEITTLRMSKKNFCHIRYRHESSIDRAIYLSGYRVRISNGNEAANFGRLHVDFAQARDDQYEYECKQRQLQREQRHRERVSLDRMRSQSPPPMPHYTDHEASVVAENLRNNETFAKAVQTITVWLERGDCTKRNANVFYSMIQSTHAHVRRLHTDKQQLEDDLRKARECYRKQMLSNATQFTQIEKVFNAASHKKVWDSLTKAQRKNIDQWKKLATELRSVQIEDDEMEMSDDDRDFVQSHTGHTKRARYDSDGLKEENDSLRCQLEAIRNEMSLERTDIKYDSDFREKQIKVLQETIRNMQTQLIQTKLREQKDGKLIEQFEQKLKEAGVKQLLLKTKIKETNAKLKDKENASSIASETSDIPNEDIDDCEEPGGLAKYKEKNDLLAQIADIDVYKGDENTKIIEGHVEDIVKPKLLAASAKEDMYLENKPKMATAAEIKDIALSEQQFALNEAKVIALTTAYLLVHPFGVAQRALCTYLKEMMLMQLPQLEAQEIAQTLKKYENLFRQQMAARVGVNGEQDVLWSFCGFHTAGEGLNDKQTVSGHTISLSNANVN